MSIAKPLSQAEIDHQHVYEHAFKGAPLDPEVARRVHERAEKVRERMKEQGVTVNSVELIRQAREEL